MHSFEIEKNSYLNQDIQGYYHSEYSGGGNWKMKGTIENLLTTLKNDVTTYEDSVLQSAVNNLNNILSSDLFKIRNSVDFENFAICVVPRSKKRR